MKAKKIPYYVLLASLTVGASLILGFLSFTGAMALWPIVPIASLFFVLSVGYEGEIYLQNLKGALDKVGFKQNFMNRKLAKEYILKFCPETPSDKDPVFFSDYVKMLHMRDKLSHATKLSLADKKKLKALDKSLKYHEKWLAELLFQQKKPQNETEQALVDWMATNKQDKWIKKAAHRRYYYYLAGAFSALTGISMSIGTTYLLVGALSTLPFVMVAPPAGLVLLVLSASIIAGSAYGLLTFNTITDMMDNKTIKKWIKKLKHDLLFQDNQLSDTKAATITSRFKRFLTGTLMLVLLSFAVALTLCTAGTWWTVINYSAPLFRWMSKIPSGVMMTLPIINGIASLSFNIQNTSQSVEMMEDLLQNDAHDAHDEHNAHDEHDERKESIWQILNPFRLILKVTFTPLRMLLFLGHLISIALTSDRLPGVPQSVSFAVGLICEGFEDVHYFFGIGHHHGHSTKDLLKEQLSDDEGHSHDNDLPVRFLRLIFSPLFYASAAWDYGFSQDRNWLQSCHKFRLIDNGYVDETAEDISFDSSLHLSKLGMNALETHIKSSAKVKHPTTDSFTLSKKVQCVTDLEAVTAVSTPGIAA